MERQSFLLFGFVSSLLAAPSPLAGAQPENIPLATAKHLKVDVRASKARCVPLEPIVLSLTIQNISENAIRLPTESVLSVVSPTGIPLKRPHRLFWHDPAAPVTVHSGQITLRRIELYIGPSKSERPRYWCSKETGQFEISIDTSGTLNKIKIQVCAPKGKHSAACRRLVDSDLADVLACQPSDEGLGDRHTALARHFVKTYRETVYGDLAAYRLGLYLLHEVDPRPGTRKKTIDVKSWPGKMQADLDNAESLLLSVGQQPSFVFAPDALFALGEMWIDHPLHDLGKAEDIAALLRKHHPESERTARMILEIACEYIHYRQDAEKGEMWLERVSAPDNPHYESYLWNRIALELLKDDRAAAKRILAEARRKFPHGIFGKPFKIYWRGRASEQLD